METDKSVNITSELLNNLEIPVGLVELSTEEEFLNALKLDRAIIYLLVDWSGPERVSRYIVLNALSETDKMGIPVFKIDCSDQAKKYIVDWLIGQRENKKEFYYGGWGETLLLSQGNIVDVIKNPAQFGRDKTREKIREWINNYT